MKFTFADIVIIRAAASLEALARRVAAEIPAGEAIPHTQPELLRAA